MDPKLPFASNKCLCPACGRYFGGVYGFDLHRQGDGNARFCADPLSLTTKSGKSLLKLNEKGYWIRDYG